MCKTSKNPLSKHKETIQKEKALKLLNKVYKTTIFCSVHGLSASDCLSSFIVGVDLFNRSINTVSHGGSWESKVLTNRLVGVQMTSLSGCTIVLSEPLDCLLPRLPSILSDIWRSSITLTARDDVQQIGCLTSHPPPDDIILPCVTDPD